VLDGADQGSSPKARQQRRREGGGGGTLQLSADRKIVTAAIMVSKPEKKDHLSGGENRGC